MNNKHSKPEKKKTKRIKEDKADKEVKKNEKIINKKEKKMKRKHPKLRIFFRCVLIFIILSIVALCAGVFAIMKTDKWTISKEELLSDGGAIVYNADGSQEIVRLTGDEINRKVSLEEMGQIPTAFISIEDERFYEHKGVDLKRSFAAIVSFVLHGGKSSFGGSTITQQLVKITMKDNENSGLAGIQRKIREWSRATQVEKMLTKDQIIQRYLNRIYLGSASGLEVRGVYAASNYYFNKTPTELTTAQAAFIAGINHAPSRYNVFNTENDISDRVKTRTKTVVEKMHSLGKINDEEYKAAIEEIDAGLKFEQGKLSNGKNSLSYHTAAALNQIANEWSEKYDVSYDEARELVINSGYKIYTTVDPNVQSKMEEVFANEKYIYKGSRAKSGVDNSGQSGMVVIEPSTGYVVGEVGGIGKQNTLGLNRGLTKRQGGSSFKPLVTIAPGLENNIITPATLFYDVKTSFGSYTVSNDSNSYHQIENMRGILTHSCNVPEVKLLSILGLNKSQEFLSKIGINVDAQHMGLSMALGTVDVSPLQMAAGYAMIANGGLYITPTFYTKVEDKDGKVLLECKQEKVQAMSAENAYLEISLLEGPVKSGTASSFASYLGKMPVSAKTGTTETAGDRWLCGMTPYYAAACWYGNDNNNGQFHNSACGGKNPAGTLWFTAMKSIHKDLAVKQHTKPEGIVSIRVCKLTGKKATDQCTDTYTEIFNKANIPGACDGHTAVRICKETGKIATEFCPDVEEKYYGMIDTEKNATWTPNLKDKAAPQEVCNVHTSPVNYTVPTVVGMKEEQARKELEAAGFTVKVQKNNDKQKAKGVVLNQNLAQAPKGAEIIITVNEYDGGKTSDDKPVTNTVSDDKDKDKEKDKNTVKENTVSNSTKENKINQD